MSGYEIGIGLLVVALLVAALVAGAQREAATAPAAPNREREKRPPFSTSDYYTELMAEERRRMEAWDFWEWCNSIAIAEVQAKRRGAGDYRVHRNALGRYVLEHFRGVAHGYRDLFAMRFWIDPNPWPEVREDWAIIGEPDGFLYRQDAMKFLGSFKRAEASRALRVAEQV